MLPHCPYCHTVYRYRDLTAMKGKEQACYHCHKTFSVRRSGRIWPVLIACLLLIVMDVVIFWTTKNLNKSTFLALIVTDAAVILLSLLIAPFFTQLKRPYRKQR